MITEHIDRSKFMINKLVEKIRKTGAPIVVGLDPMGAGSISRGGSIYRSGNAGDTRCT